MTESKTTKEEMEIKRLAAFTTDSIGINGCSEFGQPSITKIFEIVHHALRVASGHEPAVDWEDPYDARFGWKQPEPLIDRLKKHFAKEDAK